MALKVIKSGKMAGKRAYVGYAASFTFHGDQGIIVAENMMALRLMWRQLFPMFSLDETRVKQAAVSGLLVETQQPKRKAVKNAK